MKSRFTSIVVWSIAMLFCNPVVIAQQNTSKNSEATKVLGTPSYVANNTCVGNEVFFTNTSTGSYDYAKWSFGYQDALGQDVTTIRQYGGADPEHIYMNPGSYPTKLTIGLIGGAEVSTTLNITITRAPEVTISFNGELVPDDTIISVPEEDINYLYNQETFDVFQWTFISPQGSESVVGISYQAQIEGTGHYILRAEKDGCYDTDTVQTEVVRRGSVDKVEVENNAIFPSGGTYMSLRIVGLAYYTEPVDVQVYNRWGDLVYSNSDYDDTIYDGFVGVADGGKKLSAGTYYYVINSEGREGASGFIDVIW